MLWLWKCKVKARQAWYTYMIIPTILISGSRYWLKHHTMYLAFKQCADRRTVDWAFRARARAKRSVWQTRNNYRVDSLFSVLIGSGRKKWKNSGSEQELVSLHVRICVWYVYIDIRICQILEVHSIRTKSPFCSQKKKKCKCDWLCFTRTQEQNYDTWFVIGLFSHSSGRSADLPLNARIVEDKKYAPSMWHVTDCHGKCDMGLCKMYLFDFFMCAPVELYDGAHVESEIKNILKLPMCYVCI